MRLSLTALVAVAALAAGAAGQWVVETNSLRIVEPASAAGRHDAAIGDVSRGLWSWRVCACVCLRDGVVEVFGAGDVGEGRFACVEGRRRPVFKTDAAVHPPHHARPLFPRHRAPPSPLHQFGVPLYGATLAGEVQYVGGDAEGCTPFSERVRPRTPGFPVVLLVDRGDCYFIEKAYNAEKAGAQVCVCVCVYVRLRKAGRR